MQRQAGAKRRRQNYYEPDLPQPKRQSNPGGYAQGPTMNKTSSYPMYKYVSPVAKKLLPGPQVKKTEYHAVVNYPQKYENTLHFGGPDETEADVDPTIIRGALYPHISEDMRGQALTMCAQGNTSTDRTGNSVDAKGIQLYVTVNPPPYQLTNQAGAYQGLANGQFRPTGVADGEYLGYTPNGLPYSTGAQARIIVLLDKDFTGGRPPTVKEVFSDGALATTNPGAGHNDLYTTNCQLRADATQRFLVVMNKLVPATSVGQVKTIKKNIKLDGTEIRYVNSNGQSKPQNCAQNTLWLFVLADWRPFNPDNPNEKIEDAVPTYTFTSRFRFMPK